MGGGFAGEVLTSNINDISGDKWDILMNRN